MSKKQTETKDTFKERERKLAALEDAGVDAFPARVDAELTPVVEVEAESDVESYSVAGRIVARRGHGKLAFIDLREGHDQIQILCRKDMQDNFEILESLDIGDHILVSGPAIVTPRGELSIQAAHVTLLAKALRPLPDKHAGLVDPDMRYRHRELDLIANKQSFEIFQARSTVISAMRSFLDGKNFIEVETPVLQPLYGGAAATPFETDYNSLDAKMFMRIAPELYLKRCLIGGMDRVYEIGKNFRNEGLSPRHNPEFTSLEYYEAYVDYRQTAEQFKLLINFIVMKLSEKQIGLVDENVVGQLARGWQEIDFRQAIIDACGIDIDQHQSVESLASAINSSSSELEAEAENYSWAKLVDKLFSYEVEAKLDQPTLVFNYPVQLSPLAKPLTDNPAYTERWEAFLGGMELANSFSELNDPRVQLERFKEQRDSGDVEAQPYDENFIQALEQGMPPAGGVGIGVDRLVMILCGVDTIRDVVLFPALKPEVSQPNL